MRLVTDLEVLRRLAALVGLFTALIFFLNPVATVLKVDLPDFARVQKQGAVWEKSRKLPLEKFIAQRVDGRLREVSGPEWEAVVRGLFSHRQGRTPAKWIDNQPKRLKGRDREFYFSPDQEPFAKVSPGPGRVVYLALNLEGRKHYVLLNPKRPEDARDAPSSILYPLRGFAWAALALGLLIYFFLPKVKRPRGSLGYLRLRRLVISDLMGLAFAGFFFAFPLGMILDKGGGLSSLFDFEGGWAWLTICMWLLSVFGLVMIAAGAWYRTFWITFTPQGLVRHTCRGSRFYPYAEMKQASLRDKNHHWLVTMLLLLGGNNPTALGQAVILAGQKHTGIGLNMKKGKSLWIRLEAFEEPERLVRNLKENGVKLAANIKPLLKN